MKSIYLSIAAGLSALVIGCNLVESPLSDVPVSDPSVLQVVAVADRQIGPGGELVSLLRLNLYDKHGYYVKVMDGGVVVNGVRMTDSDFGAYVVEGAEVLPNYPYVFTVSLSDGSTRSCRVKTPADLRAFTVPGSYDRRAPVTLAWLDADAAMPTTIFIDGDTTSTSISVPAGRSSLTLSPQDFARFHPGQTLRVTAMLKRTGQIDGGFMSTSTVKSTFTIVRRMRI